MSPENVKMDNHPTINNIFTDENELFDDTNLKTEDKTMFREIYYIREIEIREVRTIINVTENNVPQTSQRGPSLNLRYEDVIFPDSDTKTKVDQMSDAETVDYISDIEITDKRPLHPRELLKRIFKQKNGSIKFLKNLLNNHTIG